MICGSPVNPRIRISGVQVNHLSVDTISHPPGFYRDNLHILMKVRYLFPGDIRLDPSVIDIGGEAGIIVVYFLGSVFPFDNEPQSIFIHNNILPKAEFHN